MKISIAISLLFFSCSGLIAGGDSSLDVLKYDVSPRCLAMGGACVSLGDDSMGGAYYNPASIGSLENPEASFSYSGGFEKTQINYISLASPLPYKGFSNNWKGILGASIFSSSLGKFTYRYIDPNGNVVSRNMDAEKNLAFAVSYSEKASEGETSIENYKLFFQHYLGFSLKYIKSTLLEDYSAATPALDAGYRMVEPEKGFAFGVSMSNIGGKVKYVKESYPLPQIFRAGFSLRSSPIMDQQLLFTAEYDKFIQDKDSAAKLGIEYHFQKILNFRAGYTGIQENKGFSFGLGFFLDNVYADFSTSIMSLYSYSSFSLAYRFSGLKVKDLPKKKKKIKIEEEKKPVRKSTKEKTSPKSDNYDFLMLY